VIIIITVLVMCFCAVKPAWNEYPLTRIIIIIIIIRTITITRIIFTTKTYTGLFIYVFLYSLMTLSVAAYNVE